MLAVGQQAVEVLMRRAGIQRDLRLAWLSAHPGLATAGDRVERQFHRDQPDQLWVTEITRRDQVSSTTAQYTLPSLVRRGFDNGCNDEQRVTATVTATAANYGERWRTLANADW